MNFFPLKRSVSDALNIYGKVARSALTETHTSSKDLFVNTPRTGRFRNARNVIRP